MTDKEYIQTKQRLQKYIDRWFRPMGMEWFHVDMRYERERNEDEPATVGRTVTRWQYRHADITWYIPAVADCYYDEYLEGVVVHEFCHVLMGSGVDTERMDEHEYATENVARALIWVRREEMENKKKPRIK